MVLWYIRVNCDVEMTQWEYVEELNMLNSMCKLMASIAVVRELYDAKKNVYDILVEFIREIIYRKKLYMFSDIEMTTYLNDEYSFDLSSAIVRTCLKKMNCIRENGMYTYPYTNIENSSFCNRFSESEGNTEKLFEELFKFIEAKKCPNIDKNEIRRDFCDYLLQESMGFSEKYSRFFAEFILSIEEKDELREILKNVKEGTLIYEGIRYSDSIAERGSWTSTLNIVCDTEILFAIGGYNSTLLKDLYKDLEKYVKEINSGSRERKINLLYFEETESEVNWYFERAEGIVEGKDILDPTKEAMGLIVNGCSTCSDVQIKKTLFFDTLAKANVLKINRKYYENKEYNIEDQSIISKYAKEFQEREDSIFESLKCLSHINVLRKGAKVKEFDKCEYVFLTATGCTLKMASIPEVHEKDNVSLATTLEYLINRFWFKLNKGFGSTNTPRTTDMIMRSRNILSSIITSKVAKHYDESKTDYINKKITKEQFCNIKKDLSDKLIQPSDVDSNTIVDKIDSLEKWNMEKVLEEQREKEAKYNKAEEQLDVLNKQINEVEQSNKELQDTMMCLKEGHLAEKGKLQEEIEQEKEKNKKKDDDIQRLKEKIKENEEAEEKRKKRNAKILIAISSCLALGFLAATVYGVIKDLMWVEISMAVLSVISSGITCYQFYQERRKKS